MINSHEIHKREGKEKFAAVSYRRYQAAVENCSLRCSRAALRMGGTSADCPCKAAAPPATSIMGNLSWDIWLALSSPQQLILAVK